MNLINNMSKKIYTYLIVQNEPIEKTTEFKVEGVKFAITELPDIINPDTILPLIMDMKSKL